uniref:Uncharacterized protein n=1 Tax=Klebsiella pneumoniae TaxID=573 RepID=A0A2P1BPG7_KLEPN|nr:hypothetical protein [Klebsiella pneumoniae]
MKIVKITFCFLCQNRSTHRTNSNDSTSCTLQAATETYEDEAAIQVLIDEIESQAAHRQWTDEQKASCGVVACLHNGELCILRGIQKKVKTPGRRMPLRRRPAVICM